MPWHGRIVTRGPVVIVVGEGHAGVVRRVAAWCVKHGIDRSTLPLYVTQRAVPLLDEQRALELVDSIADLRDDMQADPVLIVIDTLARNFGGGDENSAQDAGRFVQVLDEQIRQRWSCHVAIVHHSGHTPGRARGSSAFLGAMDQQFEVRVVPGQGFVYEAKKMKDAELPTFLEFVIDGSIEVGECEGAPVFGAAVRLLAGELDAVLVRSQRGGDVTIRHFLEAVDRGASHEGMRTSLAISKDSCTKGLRDICDMGHVARGENGRGFRLTDKGKVALAKTGYYISDAAQTRPAHDQDEPPVFDA